MADATGVKEYKGNASSNGVLTSGISNSALSAQISAVTLWPSGTIGNFVITVDGGLATEEKMLCSAFSGSTITIAAGGRGYDGTVAVAHSLGATVVHTISAVDFAEANWIANYHARSSKTIPADADELPLLDSASVPAFGLVKLTWANLKAAFATLYQAARGYTTTVTAAGTTTLTAASTRLQYFTGTTTQTVVLPVTSTLVAGTDRFEMVNNSTGILTLQSSGLNTILAMAANTRAVFDCILASGTTAASWSAATSISPTLIDAAGDLIVGTANDTVGRLGIGTALQVLRTNAGATAPEWAPAAAQKVVQIVNTQATASATGTTILPNDGTIPQITEGDQYMSLAITPANVNNILDILVVARVKSSLGNTEIGLAIFQDAIANALAAIGYRQVTTGVTTGIHSLHCRIIAGTTSAITFRVRAGSADAGTTTFNDSTYGAIAQSSITIIESTP
jgi:hypothetical protein